VISDVTGNKVESVFSTEKLRRELFHGQGGRIVSKTSSGRCRVHSVLAHSLTGRLDDFRVAGEP
jgi:hypothetical protein